MFPHSDPPHSHRHRHRYCYCYRCRRRCRRHAISGLAEGGDLPHLLFYGPSGAGKKTRLTALLRELFGPGVEKR